MEPIKAALTRVLVDRGLLPQEAGTWREGAAVRALVERSLAGDEAAQAALFRGYVDSAYRLAVWLLGDPDEAEDVVQEVFVQAFRALDRYDPARAPLAAWLRAITVNRCRNARRRHRPIQVPWDEVAERGAPVDDPVPGVDLRQAIWAALDQLTEKQRTVLVLRYFEGLTFAEIAQALAVPPGTAASRVAEGLAALRRKLGEAFAFEG